MDNSLKTNTFTYYINLFMNKALLVLSFFIFNISFSFAQSKHDTITEQDFYDFFNSTVNPFPVTTMGGPCNPDSVRICNLISTPEVGVLRDDTSEIFKDSVFSLADRAYIHKQAVRTKNYRWKQGMIHGVNVIDGADVQHIMDSAGTEVGWPVYFKKYKLGYNRFSVPLYSLDKTKCIVYRAYSCSDNFGLGNTNVFIKKGDKWVLLKSCAPWVH